MKHHCKDLIGIVWSKIGGKSTFPHEILFVQHSFMVIMSALSKIEKQ